ncbi:hypothetical protein ACFLTS_02655 [Chloroflexota bacterium]
MNKQRTHLYQKYFLIVTLITLVVIIITCSLACNDNVAVSPVNTPGLLPSFEPEPSSPGGAWSRSISMAYSYDEIEEIQNLVDQGQLLHRRDDPVATALEYVNGNGNYVVAGAVTDSELIWENLDKDAKVVIKTTQREYEITLAKLGHKGTVGVWFVIAVAWRYN